MGHATSGSACERYEAVAREPSDIQVHLPRLRTVAAGTVLELGVRSGNSTAALLAGVEERGGTVWSVDVQPESANVFRDHPHWRFVLADSRDAPAVDAAGLPPVVDVLFVDTIHTYEQVRQELDVWGARVRPGGLVLFHDTDTFPEIRRAIREWCRRTRTPYEYLRGSNGLALRRLRRELVARRG